MRLFSSDYLGQFLKNTAKTLLCAALLVITVASAVPAAIAMPNEAADVVMSRAATELDDKLGAGTSDKIQGKVQQDIGTVKRNVGEVTGQVDGATDQLKGKVNRDIGRTQDAIEDAAESADDAAAGFIESIKDVFD